jgi:hypothetical protein
MSLVMLEIDSTTNLPIDVYTIDAAITETYTLKAQYTTDPIEDGSSVTDHAIFSPEVAVIRGIHSNHPPIIGASLQVSPVRAEEMDERLSAAFKSATVFDIFGSLRNLVNYVITDYQVNRSSATANGLDFTMTVQELVTVSSQLFGEVTVPNITRAYPPVSVGLLPVRQANAAITAAIGIAQIALGNAL